MKHNAPDLYASGFVTNCVKTGVARLTANTNNMSRDAGWDSYVCVSIVTLYTIYFMMCY